MQDREAFLKKARRAGRMLNALAAVAPALAGRVAFRIFCSPRRVALRDSDHKFLATARTHTFHSGKDAIRSYTWEAGAGAPEVLLLHGWESSSARWKKYVGRLRDEGFTVHTIDAPASGASGGRLLNVMSYSRAVSRFVALRGAPQAIVGHSLGGAAAVMSTAILATPRPERMVLLGVFAESTRVIRDFGAVMGVNDAVLNGIFREIERRSGIPAAEYSIAGKAALLHDVRGLVLHDRDDEVAPVAEGRAIADAWKAAFVETQGLGHRMQADSVVEEIVGFLSSA